MDDVFIEDDETSIIIFHQYFFSIMFSLILLANIFFSIVFPLYPARTLLTAATWYKYAGHRVYSTHFSVELTNGFQFLEGRRIAMIQTRSELDNDAVHSASPTTKIILVVVNLV
jgi:hypothetical protein